MKIKTTAAEASCRDLTVPPTALTPFAAVGLVLALSSGCTTSRVAADADTDAGPVDATVVPHDAPDSRDATSLEDAPGVACAGGTWLVVRTPDAEYRFDSAHFGVRLPECSEWLELYFTRTGEWRCGDPVESDTPPPPDDVLVLLWLPPESAGWQVERTWMSLASTTAAFQTEVELFRQEDPVAGSPGALTGRIRNGADTYDGWTVEGCFDAAYCDRFVPICR